MHAKTRLTPPFAPFFVRFWPVRHCSALKTDTNCHITCASDKKSPAALRFNSPAGTYISRRSAPGVSPQNRTGDDSRVQFDSPTDWALGFASSLSTNYERGLLGRAMTLILAPSGMRVSSSAASSGSDFDAVASCREYPASRKSATNAAKLWWFSAWT